MITSRGMGDERAVAISQQDFVEGGLPLDSNVRPNRLFTANEQIILKTVGRLSHEAMNDVVNEVVQLVTA